MASLDLSTFEDRKDAQEPPPLYSNLSEDRKDAQEPVFAAEASEEGTVTPPPLYSKTSTIFMIIFSGLALGSDGFNSSIIGYVELLFAEIYPDLPASIYSHLSNAFLIGMIIGMLGFGYISDRLGRKSGAVLTTGLLVLGIALSAASSGKTKNGMFWMLIISRGIAGVGAGGEYPVAGAGATEATDEAAGVRKHRGFIFAMIGDLAATFGFVFGGLVPLLLVLCFRQKPEHYEAVWRISLGLGLIPPISIFWFRYKMAVSTAYRKSAARKQRVPYWLIFKRYWRPLLGCSISWFLYNYISYPFGIFASTILSRLNVGSSITKNLGYGTLINCFYIPGAIIGGILSDKIGRRRTMALGFFVQAILGFIIGGALGSIQTVLPLFIVLYGIFLTLGEVGPGATIVLTSSESFPTSVRGQCMGFISAFGKAGAAIGTSVFAPILASFGDSTYQGNQALFLIGSAFAFAGAISTWFIIPDISSELDSEDDKWKAYLKECGYEIEWGDEKTKDPKGLTKSDIKT